MAMANTRAYYDTAVKSFIVQAPGGKRSNLLCCNFVEFTQVWWNYLHEESFTDAVVRVVDAVSVAPEPLPGQPAHRRGPGEAVFESGGQSEADKNQTYDPAWLKRQWSILSLSSIVNCILKYVLNYHSRLLSDRHLDHWHLIDRHFADRHLDRHLANRYWPTDIWPTDIWPTDI
jgi:hypothetical protein